MSGSACFASLGYSNEYVIRAIKEQLEAIPHAFAGLGTSDAAEKAADLISRPLEKANPGWFGKCLFQQGGGETVDLACKLAAQYHLEKEQNHRQRFAALEFSYHGVGLLPFSLSGGYPRYALIDPYHGVTNNCVSRLAHPIISNTQDRTKEIIYSEKLAAVIIEPIGGPPLGACPLPGWYVKKLRQLCDDTDTLLIFDEILCGAGRCGYMSMAEYYDVWPDILLLGKGLTSGYQPMSAIVVSKKVCDRIKQGSGTIMFGTCYANHTTGCAAVAATLEYCYQHALFEVVRQNGEFIHKLLSQAFQQPKFQIRGRGHLWGIELRHPDATYFQPSTQFHMKARKAILDAGAIVYSKGQTVNGKGDFITLAPMYEMTHAVMEMGVEIIAEGLKNAYQGV
jgi:adenosylmethionine-8-amino-7-oxononanoate aminotransferase